METEFKRYYKYEVIKVDDIKKYLKLQQRKNLLDVLDTIRNGRESEGKTENSYVVVNEDQPYAEQVWKLIQKQWEKDDKI